MFVSILMTKKYVMAVANRSATNINTEDAENPKKTERKLLNL